MHATTFSLPSLFYSCKEQSLSKDLKQWLICLSDVSTSALDKLDILQDQGSSTLTKVEHLDKHVTNSEIDAARRRVRKWLLPCDPSTNYGSAVKTHHQGTGQWFLDLAEFIKWKVDHNSFFWAHGIRM